MNKTEMTIEEWCEAYEDIARDHIKRNEVECEFGKPADLEFLDVIDNNPRKGFVINKDKILVQATKMFTKQQQLKKE